MRYGAIVDLILVRIWLNLMYRPLCFLCGVILVQTPPVTGVTSVSWSTRLVVVRLGKVFLCI